MVLLNAGLGSLKWELAKSGHEKTIQVNLLSPALMALELLPVLEKREAITAVPSRLTGWAVLCSSTTASIRNLSGCAERAQAF